MVHSRVIAIANIQAVTNETVAYERSKSKLTLKKIIVSIEGDSLFSGCGFGLKECDENNPCPLHFSYAPIRNAIEKLVTDETIQTLAQKLDKNEKFTLGRIIQTGL